ncbi:S9 family peptidase [Pseudomonas sp. ABC1]|uniref:alpha/beta hydrolase family protein n=1 Tax=Pseudomonas sp. ABC1 TaxID=2748080 RepID=UPI0015C32622|nr:prolyl oligopeptidase family serine peptidase [Pseudomonas sp. ABC1]QLF94715.1 S9 family peptidase [Pseudomonas sp. ABC1]
MTKTTFGFGFWPGDWSADQAAAASGDFAELQAGHGGLFWTLFEPTLGACRLWFHRDGQARCLTPAGFSLRSRVYEYGGGALCMTERGVAFVNESDQQLYQQTLEGAPQRVSLREGCRYGDLCFDPQRQALLAVEEEQGDQGVIHRLVSIGLADARRTVVAEGRDFYAGPCLSADGSTLAWIEWQRPEQPWTCTRLCQAQWGAGGWQGAQCLADRTAGGQDVSWQQPRFCREGQLYCMGDADGWWQPWRWTEGNMRPLMADSRFDHAPSPWQLGVVSYLPLGDELLLCRLDQGFGHLILRDGQGRERRLAADFSRFRQLSWDEGFFYCIAAAEDRLPAVLAIERRTGAVRVLAGGAYPVPPERVSRPQALCFESGEGKAHAFFYPPVVAPGLDMGDERPPLVVFLHGGPTSACYPVFDPRIQFWTQRGFAVADLNYRGSSGFGREYRQCLRGQWGVFDVQDAHALRNHLADEGLVDAGRTFIRGGSAGGYTALNALVGNTCFRGAASLYGVSDPLSLRRVTHKFEADYLDWLIGDPQRQAARYRARAPLHNAQRIETPVIFFQGGQDAVVLPEQTASMVVALRARGVPVEYRLYAQERHGFRQAENLADALMCELRFYQALL